MEQIVKKKRIIHGMTNTPEFRAWQKMIGRCYDKNDKSYHNYGGRGIVVCDRWRYSFENFFADMGKRPTDKHTLDRHPNNKTGIYELNNCRWATHDQQAINKRNNVWVEHMGIKMVVTHWAKYFGVSQGNLSDMMKKKTFADIYNFYNTKLNGIFSNRV